MSFTVEPATPQTARDAFQLMYAEEPAEIRKQLVTDSLHLLKTGELRYENLLLLFSEDQLIGMTVWWTNTAGGGQLWPPRVRSSLDSCAHEDSLMIAALSCLKNSDCKLIQTLLTENELPLAEPLLRHGFTRVTTLLSMICDLQSTNAPPTTDDWQFVPFSEETKPRFQDTIARSYVDTLDFPELLGTRSLDEVLEGHKYHGQFDPRFWLLAEHHGRPAAVLLLTEVPGWSEWELAYLGVVPEFRGRGVGKMLTALAISMSRNTGARRLHVSVDVRNEPARRLYEQAGFHLESEKHVFLHWLE